MCVCVSTGKSSWWWHLAAHLFCLSLSVMQQGFHSSDCRTGNVQESPHGLCRTQVSSSFLSRWLMTLFSSGWCIFPSVSFDALTKDLPFILLQWLPEQLIAHLQQGLVIHTMRHQLMFSLCKHSTGVVWWWQQECCQQKPDWSFELDGKPLPGFSLGLRLHPASTEAPARGRKDTLSTRTVLLLVVLHVSSLRYQQTAATPDRHPQSLWFGLLVPEEHPACLNCFKESSQWDTAVCRTLVFFCFFLFPYFDISPNSKQRSDFKRVYWEGIFFPFTVSDDFVSRIVLFSSPENWKINVLGQMVHICVGRVFKCQLPFKYKRNKK